MLTRTYALELAPYGIRVNVVNPGFAPGSEVSRLDEDYVEMMIRTIPLGRTSGPHDSSEAVLFRCSDRASYITGTTLTVDGGRSAGIVPGAQR
jgi:3-oxoacyl-[acyl-carrier protein] reductase